MDLWIHGSAASAAASVAASAAAVLLLLLLLPFLLAPSSRHIKSNISRILKSRILKEVKYGSMDPWIHGSAAGVAARAAAGVAAGVAASAAV